MVEVLVTTSVALAAAYLLVINLASLVAFGFDKRRATNDGPRLSEAFLLRLALIGGSLGAKYGQRRFRHKTRKQPFATWLNVILGLHAVLLVAALVWRPA